MIQNHLRRLSNVKKYVNSNSRQKVKIISISWPKVSVQLRVEYFIASHQFEVLFKILSAILG